MLIVHIPEHYQIGELYLCQLPVEQCPICGQAAVVVAGRYVHSFIVHEGRGRRGKRTPGQVCGPTLDPQ